MPQIILFIGLVIFVIGGVWFLIAAFQQSILWGLGCLFLPIIPLIFLFVHWPAAKKPFLLQMAGTALVIVGAFFGGYGIFKPH